MHLLMAMGHMDLGHSEDHPLAKEATSSEGGLEVGPSAEVEELVLIVVGIQAMILVVDRRTVAGSGKAKLQY